MKQQIWIYLEPYDGGVWYSGNKITVVEDILPMVTVVGNGFGAKFHEWNGELTYTRTGIFIDRKKTR